MPDLILGCHSERSESGVEAATQRTKGARPGFQSRLMLLSFEIRDASTSLGMTILLRSAIKSARAF